MSLKPHREKPTKLPFMKERLPKERHFYFSHYLSSNSDYTMSVAVLELSSSHLPLGYWFVRKPPLLSFLHVRTTMLRTQLERGFAVTQSILGSTGNPFCRLGTVHAETHIPSHSAPLHAVTQSAVHRLLGAGKAISSAECSTWSKCWLEAAC